MSCWWYLFLFAPADDIFFIPYMVHCPILLHFSLKEKAQARKQPTLSKRCCHIINIVTTVLLYGTRQGGWLHDANSMCKMLTQQSYSLSLSLSRKLPAVCYWKSHSQYDSSLQVNTVIWSYHFCEMTLNHRERSIVSYYVQGWWSRATRSFSFCYSKMSGIRKLWNLLSYIGTKIFRL